jgi:hypothetical protein
MDRAQGVCVPNMKPCLLLLEGAIGEWRISGAGATSIKGTHVGMGPSLTEIDFVTMQH